jgi:hypothetical protein
MRTSPHWIPACGKNDADQGLFRGPHVNPVAEEVERFGGLLECGAPPLTRQQIGRFLHAGGSRSVERHQQQELPVGQPQEPERLVEEAPH